MTQQVRLSQFVITYGPGTILEGPRGPRIIPRPDIGLFNDEQKLGWLNRLEISDQRMSQGLLNGARIFRLPSNAELGILDRYYIYGTKPFPAWSLCLNTSGHPGRTGILYSGRGCPVCRREGRRSQEAIRFIRACSQGHLDDVDWHYVVHRGAECPRSNAFLWHGGGGALSQVQIECPSCGRSANLGRAYGQDWLCSGRNPELEPLDSYAPNRPGGCNSPSRIIQRQASNLRLPELQTLFTIPPRDTNLHKILGSSSIYPALVATGAANFDHFDQFIEVLGRLLDQGILSQTTIEEIKSYPWPEVKQAIQDVLSRISHEFTELLLEEFYALISASKNGHPPVYGTTSVVFEVNKENVKRFAGPNNRRLRVTPVSRLRTVTVQVGYRREIRAGQNNAQNPANIVPVSFRDRMNHTWLPGVEFLGEGIFIMLDEDDGWHFDLAGDAAYKWWSTWIDPQGGDYPGHLFRTGNFDELHPVFVWWHTLSHLLIRAISVDSGYSSAAIRGRVYIEIDAENSRARGGIILYATQPGSEGSLGGLIALVPNFDDVIRRAIDMAEVCSNDPLCLETSFNTGSYNGASCYSCSLVSETSCEHRNLWLDRQVLLDNLP